MGACHCATPPSPEKCILNNFSTCASREAKLQISPFIKHAKLIYKAGCIETEEHISNGDFN